MLHAHVANLVAPGAVTPGHRSERFRKRAPRPMSPIRASRKAELGYRADLNILVGAYQRIAAEHLLPGLRAEYPGKFTHDASTIEWARNYVNAIRKRFGGIGKKAEQIATKHVGIVATTVDQRLTMGVQKSLGVNIAPYLTGQGRYAEVMGEKILQNVNLIRTIPEEFFDKIADAAAKNWLEGGRWETLTARIQEIGGVTESRAAVIARDQTAKLNTAFNQVRQVDLGIESYIWRTSDDERVRESHDEVDGQEFSWSEPGPVAGSVDGEPCHPGEDILCRCDAAPQINLNALAALADGVP